MNMNNIYKIVSAYAAVMTVTMIIIFTYNQGVKQGEQNTKDQVNEIAMSEKTSGVAYHRIINEVLSY